MDQIEISQDDRSSSVSLNDSYVSSEDGHSLSSEEDLRTPSPPASPESYHSGHDSDGNTLSPLFFLGCSNKKVKNMSVPWKPKKEKGPLQIEKSKASILYDKEGRTYIDCISGVSHVGHAHPKIVSVFHQQLGTIGTGMISTTPDSIWHKLQRNSQKENFIANSTIASQETEDCISSTKIDNHILTNPKSRLVERLLKTLNSPDTLETALAFSSGSQANDIAIQLARAYTGNYDVIIFEESFHGGLSIGADMSAKMMYKTQKDNVAPRPISRGPVSKKPKVGSLHDNSNDSSNVDEDDEHGSLFCTSRSGNGSKWSPTDSASSLKSDLHLDNEKETNTYCCQEHFALSMAPTYSNKPDWVHVLPIPDIKRGYYRHEEASIATENYINDAKIMINNQLRKGRKIACLIAEPAFTFYNGLVPPSKYFQEISSFIREIGGLVICDEVQTGLGRLGHHWWGFQIHNIAPDIVTMGKALNNGHPISFLFTSHKILGSLGQSLAKVHRLTPCQEALGNCVMDILDEEQLLENCIEVGKYVQESIQELMKKHSCISNINGMGLMIGIEISSKYDQNRPNANMAMIVRNRLKEKRIIVAVEGKNRNIIYILPPLCFSQQNAKIFVEQLDVVISELSEEILDGKPLPTSEPVPFPNWSRKRHATGRHPLHLVNRGLMKNLRPNSRGEGPSPSFSFWNRDKTEEIEEVDLDERAESKTRKGHLSQKQYHFFSVRETEDETLTMDNILTKSSSFESLDDDATEIPTFGTEITAISSPDHGAYDDLD